MILMCVSQWNGSLPGIFTYIWLFFYRKLIGKYIHGSYGLDGLVQLAP